VARPPVEQSVIGSALTPSAYRPGTLRSTRPTPNGLETAATGDALVTASSVVAHDHGGPDPVFESVSASSIRWYACWVAARASDSTILLRSLRRTRAEAFSCSSSLNVPGSNRSLSPAGSRLSLVRGPYAVGAVWASLSSLVVPLVTTTRLSPRSPSGSDAVGPAVLTVSLNARRRTVRRLRLRAWRGLFDCPHQGRLAWLELTFVVFAIASIDRASPPSGCSRVPPERCAGSRGTGRCGAIAWAPPVPVGVPTGGVHHVSRRRS